MIGIDLHSFAKKLWKHNRSILGEGLRQTLNTIKNDHLKNLNIKSIPSGTKVFDWEVPLEWYVSKAYIVTPDGNKICDFSLNNLHLVGYSIPFHRKMQLEELQKYLHSLPQQPNAIPYVTSYYKQQWGFCLTQEQRDALDDGEYEVVIDSKLFLGKLNYGELILPGKNSKEIFLSTYVCHPSMANNELSGPVVATYLAKWLNDQKERYYTYRFVFIPETIGSIAYLSKNYINLKKKVIAGFNISCVGDDRNYSYLPSRNGNTISDKVARHVLKWIDPDYKSYAWLDRGSDERQYCSPGIDLPVASILRTKYGEYPEYHTSLDNLNDVVTPKGLNGGYWALRRALELIDKNRIYKTKNLCEPQMSKRGLYPKLSIKMSSEKNRNMMNFLSYCDGEHSLLDIAEKINRPSWDLYELVDQLISYDLISSI
jgi:aminopeptidase-like protein